MAGIEVAKTAASSTNVDVLEGREGRCLNAPLSLLNGVEAAARAVLGIASTRHRSSLLTVGGRSTFPSGVVDAVYGAIATNWERYRAACAPTRSTANWRWRVPQLAIAAHNASPEVRLERTLMNACERQGRTDWSNQVPVASGIGGASRQRRRAIDLVHQKGPGYFELIELKIASDTPLYAAIEIIGYTIIWLLSRDKASENPLLSAQRIDARVLAPASYYARYDLGALARLLGEELAALGARHDVTLSFVFEQFSDALADFPYSDERLLAVLDGRRPI